MSHTFWVYGNSGETFTTEDFTIVYDGGTQTNTETTSHTLSLTGWNVVIHEYAVPDNVTSYQFRIKANSTTIWVDDYEANINDFAVSSAELDVLSFTDYYAFGMAMEGRISQNDEYRYGFQGQEKEDELKGNGNVYSYTYRFHDARLGRFFSVDPLEPQYPYNSPYAFSENRVIDGVDLEGREFEHFWILEKINEDIKKQSDIKGLADNKALETMYEFNKWIIKFGQGAGKATPPGSLFTTIQGLVEHVKTLKEEAQMVESGQMTLDAFIEKHKDEFKSGEVKLAESMKELGKKLANGDPEAWGGLVSTLVQAGGTIKGIKASKGSGAVKSTAKAKTASSQKSISSKPLDIEQVQKTAAQNTAKEVMTAPSNRKMSDIVTTIVDENTGQVYSGLKKAAKGKKLEPKVKKEMPKVSKEKWSCDNCAEVDALNKAVKGGAKVGKNLKVYTYEINKKTRVMTPKETCKNCKVTMDKTEVLSDKKK